MKRIISKIFDLIKKAVKYPVETYRAKVSLWKKCLIWLAWALAVFHVVIIFGGLFFAVLYKFVNPPYSSFMLYRMVFAGEEIHQNDFVPLKKLPKGTASMLVRLEDGNFYNHWGIDLEAIESARKRNDKAGYNKYGGSTLTQQLVKTLLLVPDKFLVRKYAEVIISLEFDLIISKDRILELYLNNVEWGHGIFGIEAASVHHFNKHAVRMSRDEVARLITILPNPLKYNVKNFSRRKSMSLRYNRLMPIIPDDKIKTEQQKGDTLNLKLN